MGFIFFPWHLWQSQQTVYVDYKPNHLNQGLDKNLRSWLKLWVVLLLCVQLVQHTWFKFVLLDQVYWDIWLIVFLVGVDGFSEVDFIHQLVTSLSQYPLVIPDCSMTTLSLSHQFHNDQTFMKSLTVSSYSLQVLFHLSLIFLLIQLQLSNFPYSSTSSFIHIAIPTFLFTKFHLL